MQKFVKYVKIAIFCHSFVLLRSACPSEVCIYCYNLLNMEYIDNPFSTFFSYILKHFDCFILKTQLREAVNNALKHCQK